MTNNVFFRNSNKDTGEHWLTISDLMSGLMIVFLFIAVAFMRYSTIEKDKIKEIAIAYQENQIAIYNALNTEFDKDLPKWDASIDKNSLSFQFNSPDILFEIGSSEINDKFKVILIDFIPRYLKTLEKFESSINEIRIEGHTSTEWRYLTTKDEAYFYNMELSQDRTRSVLRYAYFIPKISSSQRNWIKSSFAAVGFSSSKIIISANAEEDKARSRRVTFRVITNAEIQIRKIVEGR